MEGPKKLIWTIFKAAGLGMGQEIVPDGGDSKENWVLLAS